MQDVLGRLFIIKPLKGLKNLGLLQSKESNTLFSSLSAKVVAVNQSATRTADFLSCGKYYLNLKL